MANTKGLGKGLSALLGDDVIAAKDERASSLLLPISQVESCSTQPRKSFDPEALSDLADSIRVHGIIQPLTVRKLQSGYYQIIAGERRWRAARMAGLTQVPAVVIEADDRKAMELAMIENLQREDLNPIEEAEGYRVLTEQYGMTQDECAQRVGKSRPAVANALRLLGLSEPVRAMVEDGRLSAGHARALVTLGARQQQAAAETVVKDALSVNYAEDAARELGEKLGRPCRIVNGKKKGRIELEYYGTDDLNALREAREKLGRKEAFHVKQARLPPAAGRISGCRAGPMCPAAKRALITAGHAGPALREYPSQTQRSAEQPTNTI